MNRMYEPGVENVFEVRHPFLVGTHFQTFVCKFRVHGCIGTHLLRSLCCQWLHHAVQRTLLSYLTHAIWNIVLGECTFELGSERVSDQTVFAHRYGNEDKLATLMGVMQALTAFVQDDNNLIRFVTYDISFLICNLWHKKCMCFPP